MNPVKAFKDAPRRRKSLKAAAERAVVRWEWASWGRPAIEPFTFERGGFAPGKPIAKPRGTPKSGVHAYGYDAEGRLVLEREHTSWKGLTKDTYFVHTDEGIEEWHFDKEWAGEARVINVGWYEVDEERRVVSSWFAYAHGKPVKHTYLWKKGLLRQITGPVDERLSYDKDGQLTTVTKDGQVSYTRAVPGQLLADLAPAIAKELEASIRKQVAKLRSEEQVRALVLVIDEENYRYTLPPILAAPTVSERARHPAEWELFDVDELEYETKKLLALCDTANQDIWQNERFREAHAVVKGVAAKLTARAPAGRGWRRAKGFTCFVVNLESGKRL
jgi:YD repeat-containing protein